MQHTSCVNDQFAELDLSMDSRFGKDMAKLRMGCVDANTKGVGGFLERLSFDENMKQSGFGRRQRVDACNQTHAGLPGKLDFRDKNDRCGMLSADRQCTTR